MRKPSEKKLSELQELTREERLLQGKKRAMRLLEHRDYSRKELAEKLAEDGYEEDMLAEILAYLDSYHYLDDVRYAGNLIRSRKTVKSHKELLHYLRTKGLSEEAIEAAMESNYHMEEESSYSLCTKTEEEQEQKVDISPETVAIRKQLQKCHVTEDALLTMEYAMKRKIAAKLYRKGYSEENIRRELHM